MNTSAFPGQTLQPIPMNPGPVNDDQFSLLQKIAQSLYNLSISGGLGGAGVIVVNGTAYAYNSQVFTYFGATNNIQTIVYKNGSTTVATQTFTYVGGGGSDDDDIQSITTT